MNGSTIYTGIPTGTDFDGDGIEAADNCPRVFNPVRPLDGGVQADSDGDGVGDACDAVAPRIPALRDGGLLLLAVALLIVAFWVQGARRRYARGVS